VSDLTSLLTDEAPRPDARIFANEIRVR